MFDIVKAKIKIYLEFFVCYNRRRLENNLPMALEYSTIKTNFPAASPESGMKTCSPVMLHDLPNYR